MPQFNILQGIQPGKIIGQLAPQPSSDEGIGGLLEGIQGLVKGFQSKPEASPQASVSNSIQNPNTFGTTFKQPTLQQSSIARAMPNLSYDQLSKTPAFQEAYQAQQRALMSGVTKSPILTVVDYSKPANEQRLFSVDTSKNQILMSSYVAHGAGSGKGLIPTSFSNQEGSHATSLGTYLTGDTYKGKHGESLRVKGLDSSNNNAFNRAVVVHGGSYIGPDKQGTSWGCFTVPNEVAPKLVGLTKGGSIIHAYAPNQEAVNQFSNTLPKTTRENLQNSVLNIPGQTNRNNYQQNLSSYQQQNRQVIPTIDPFKQKNYTPANQDISTNTLDTIKKFEGFSNKPYWDVNAYRAGYGSDTYTSADGKVNRVTPNSFVSREDAERDLARRTQEFANTARNQVGDKVWSNLSPGAQTALTSISYNYGSLPKRVLPALRTGDPRVMSEAVKSLQYDNKGVNKARRLKEANMILEPNTGQEQSKMQLTLNDEVPLQPRPAKPIYHIPLQPNPGFQGTMPQRGPLPLTMAMSQQNQQVPESNQSNTGVNWGLLQQILASDQSNLV